MKANLILTVSEAKSGEERLFHLAADSRRKSGRERGRKGGDKANP